MATNAETAVETLTSKLGKPEGIGEWFEITQAQVNQFADVTHDHQFIHVDPEAAKATPFGGTIAHGFLTLSMLSKLVISIPGDSSIVKGLTMGVNYGFDKVRFISPVRVGKRIRASSVISDVQLKDPNSLQTTRTVIIEIEGETKPACVADWLTRLFYS